MGAPGQTIRTGWRAGPADLTASMSLIASWSEAEAMPGKVPAAGEWMAMSFDLARKALVQMMRPIWITGPAPTPRSGRSTRPPGTRWRRPLTAFVSHQDVNRVTPDRAIQTAESGGDYRHVLRATIRARSRHLLPAARHAAAVQPALPAGEGLPAGRPVPAAAASRLRAQSKELTPT
jgi:hypothetical protein